MTLTELEIRTKNILIEIPNSIPIMINIDTHRIINWIEGSEPKNIEVKVVDAGIYTLYDDLGNMLVKMQGYVPNKLLPGEWGDYLYLNIDSNGYVTNWLDDYNLMDFENEVDI